MLPGPDLERDSCSRGVSGSNLQPGTGCGQKERLVCVWGGCSKYLMSPPLSVPG